MKAFKKSSLQILKSWSKRKKSTACNIFVLEEKETSHFLILVKGAFS